MTGLNNFLRKDAELYKKVLMNAYTRLKQVYPRDASEVREQLLNLFPDDKKAVEYFLANTGKTPESVHEMGKSSSKKVAGEDYTLRQSIMVATDGMYEFMKSLRRAGADMRDLNEVQEAISVLERVYGKIQDMGLEVDRRYTGEGAGDTAGGTR